MEDSDISKKDKLIFGLGTFVFVLVLATSGWLFYFYNFEFNKQKANAPVSQETVTETKEKTVVQDYKNTNIEILNGSGKPGVAAKLAEKLKAKGYTDIATGNYDSVVIGNLLFAPKEIVGFINDLKDSGFDDYKFASASAIKIVIGK